MSYSRIFEVNDQVDSSLFYQYLCMSVEDAEYPTAVPLAVAAAILIPGYFGVKYLAEKVGLFAAETQIKKQGHISYLNIGGP